MVQPVPFNLARRPIERGGLPEWPAGRRVLRTDYRADRRRRGGTVEQRQRLDWTPGSRRPGTRPTRRLGLGADFRMVEIGRGVRISLTPRTVSPDVVEVYACRRPAGRVIAGAPGLTARRSAGPRPPRSRARENTKTSAELAQKPPPRRSLPASRELRESIARLRREGAPSSSDATLPRGRRTTTACPAPVYLAAEAGDMARARDEYQGRRSALANRARRSRTSVVEWVRRRASRGRWVPTSIDDACAAPPTDLVIIEPRSEPMIAGWAGARPSPLPRRRRAGGGSHGSARSCASGGRLGRSRRDRARAALWQLHAEGRRVPLGPQGRRGRYTRPALRSLRRPARPLPPGATVRSSVDRIRRHSRGPGSRRSTRRGFGEENRRSWGANRRSRNQRPARHAGYHGPSWTTRDPLRATRSRATS